MDPSLKTALLLVATGNYRQLAQNLLDSLDTHLLDEDLEVFLFADQPGVASKRFPVRFCAIGHQPWPLVTLNRYQYFMTQHAALAAFSRVLYMDCDLELITDLELHELLTPGNICAVEHPARHLPGGHFWDVETNTMSTACLPADARGTYYQGCLWGGDTRLILPMIATLEAHTELDKARGITAKWHDESHLNHYLFHQPQLTAGIHSSFAYPETWDLPFSKRIIHKDKILADFPRFPSDQTASRKQSKRFFRQRPLVIKEHSLLPEYLGDGPLQLVDLGACMGEFSDELARHFPIGKALLVEASPTNFIKIQARNNRLRLHRVAVGTEGTGTRRFLEDTESPYNGSVVFDYFKDSSRTHSIETITLPEILQHFEPDRRIDVLKIDIEGAEYELLEQAPDWALARFRQITVEFHDFVDPALRARNAAIVKKMRRIGFTVLKNATRYKHGSEFYDTLFYQRPKWGRWPRLIGLGKS